MIRSLAPCISYLRYTRKIQSCSVSHQWLAATGWESLTSASLLEEVGAGFRALAEPRSALLWSWKPHHHQGRLILQTQENDAWMLCNTRSKYCGLSILFALVPKPVSSSPLLPLEFAIIYQSMTWASFSGLRTLPFHCFRDGLLLALGGPWHFRNISHQHNISETTWWCFQVRLKIPSGFSFSHRLF